jgi:hypothetical protein
MTTIRTGNARAAAKHRRLVKDEGRAFHEAQVSRMFLSDTLHKLKTTRYAVNAVRKQRAVIRSRHDATDRAVRADVRREPKAVRPVDRDYEGYSMGARLMDDARESTRAFKQG